MAHCCLLKEVSGVIAATLLDCFDERKTSVRHHSETIQQIIFSNVKKYLPDNQVLSPSVLYCFI